MRYEKPPEKTSGDKQSGDKQTEVLKTDHSVNKRTESPIKSPPPKQKNVTSMPMEIP
jgi:hypothetical protein